MRSTIISFVCLLLVLGLSNSMPHIPSSRDALHASVGDLHESHDALVIPGKTKSVHAVRNADSGHMTMLSAVMVVCTAIDKL